MKGEVHKREWGKRWLTGAVSVVKTSFVDSMCKMTKTRPDYGRVYALEYFLLNIREVKNIRG